MKEDMYYLELVPNVLLRLSKVIKEMCIKAGLQLFDLWEFAKCCLELVFEEKPGLDELAGIEGICDPEEGCDGTCLREEEENPVMESREYLLNTVSYLKDKEVNIKKIKKPQNKLEFMNWVVHRTMMEVGVYAQKVGDPDRGETTER
jgi:hypothetical protein